MHKLTKSINEITLLTNSCEIQLAKLLFNNKCFVDKDLSDNPICVYIKLLHNIETYFKTPKIISTKDNKYEFHVPTYISRFIISMTNYKYLSLINFINIEDLLSVLLKNNTCDDKDFLPHSIAFTLRNYLIISNIEHILENPIKVLVEDKLNISVNIDNSYLLINRSAIRFDDAIIDFNKLYLSNYYGTLFHNAIVRLIPKFHYIKPIPTKGKENSDINILVFDKIKNAKHNTLLLNSNFKFFRCHSSNHFIIQSKLLTDSIVFYTKEF